MAATRVEPATIPSWSNRGGLQATTSNNFLNLSPESLGLKNVRKTEKVSVFWKPRNRIFGSEEVETKTGNGKDVLSLKGWRRDFRPKNQIPDVGFNGGGSTGQAFSRSFGSPEFKTLKQRLAFFFSLLYTVKFCNDVRQINAFYIVDSILPSSADSTSIVT